MSTIPHGNPGLAQGVDTENFKHFEAFLSDTPEPLTQTFKMPKVASGNAVTHEFLTVMALNSSGKIHQAADNTSRTDDGCARVVLAGKYTQQRASDGAEITVAAYVSGHFNIDALVWDDAFDNDAKKLAAFGSFGTGDYINPGQIKVGINAHHRKS